MKDKYRLKIFEFLEGAVQAVGDILFVFTLPYRTSYSRMEYLLEKRHEEAEKEEFKKGNKRTRRNFSDFIYRLKKDGLVIEIVKKKKRFLKLTEKGRKILQILRENKPALPPRKYESEEDNLLKIIIFDIPEAEKRKREWLRDTLRNLKFTMLQKSVWAGKTKLPPEFIKDLDELNILSYVEIFAISRAGSLKQIK